MGIQSVGVIGLGIMGLPMARHLLAGQNLVHVFTRTKDKAELLVADGARWCASPAEVAARANFVFLCLPDTPDVLKVVLGPDGVLSSVREGSVIIDHSTISPAITRDLA